jgi:hypothetical protein
MNSKTVNTVRKKVPGASAPLSGVVSTGWGYGARAYPYGADLDVDYDSYGAPGGQCECPEDDYCRCNVYEGLRIDPDVKPNMENVLSYATGIPHSELPESLLTLGRELELDTHDGYEVFGEAGYYGQEYRIEFANVPKVHKELRDRFDKNAIDRNDIPRSYLAGIGIDVRGKDPVRGFKEFLKKENAGIELEKLKKVKKVTSTRLNLSSIEVPNPEHYKGVEPRKPESPIEGTSKVVGIVLKEGGKYKLLDGYHRLKYARGGSIKTGRFIVLS